MTGGRIRPPVEAVASTAPAKYAGNPSRFIAGIVNAPVVMTLAMGAPLILEKRLLAIIATLALPALVFPTKANAISLKNLPALSRCKIMAKVIKPKKSLPKT